MSAQDTYRLCRRGHSGSKPFCDGSHTTVQFDRTESADWCPISNRIKTFRSRKIFIQEDHSICVRLGFCRDTVSDIWSMRRHSSDPEVLAKIIDKPDNCPPGALAYAFGVWRRDNRAGPEKIRDSYVGLHFRT
ncbi:MAG: CDGSH iron-sulfur domain-containing protein [Dehalococcoidia bacterium]|nr:CDGSH iron-sulfur domain-containing protein [Dehalococcoidia bacterium]